MIDALKRYIQRQQFSPGPGGIFVNPFFLARRGLDRVIASYASGMHGALLDIGCGTKPYEGYFDVTAYIGLEIEPDESRAASQRSADCYYDGKRIPFADARFDAVVCNQVLEHVFEPGEFLAEISRVLKPGGRLLVTIPFVWDEHEQPHDFARYSSFGLAHLIARQGLVIERHDKVNDDIGVIFQLLNAYLYKITLGLPSFLRFAVTITLMATINLVGVIARLLLPKNTDLFLDQIMMARKPENEDA